MVIRLDDVSVQLRRRRVLAGISAQFDVGVTVITGANGAGKSTLVRAIAGLQRHRGRISIESSTEAGRRPLHVCFDDAPIIPLVSAGECLRALAGSMASADSIARAAEPLLGRDVLGRRAGSLSHGARRRLHLAAALLVDAEHLLLDEALNGLDPDGLELALELLGRAGRRGTVVITSHAPLAIPGARTLELRAPTVPAAS